jgi:hypothetical protein
MVQVEKMVFGMRKTALKDKKIAELSLMVSLVRKVSFMRGACSDENIIGEIRLLLGAVDLDSHF